MFHDLARSARDLLAVDPARESGPGSVLGRVTDLLFYGDFEIFEQLASISDADHTNLVGYKAGRQPTGGLLLSAPLGAIGRRRAGPRDDDVPAIRDGRVVGRGAASGRLALLCQIAAAASFPRGELQRPVMVAGTFGQEHRGSGTHYLLESGHVDPEWVVVGADTNLEIVRAHRGYMVFEVEVVPQGDQWRGGFPVRSGHRVTVPGTTAGSVLPGAGRSAFERALALTDALSAAGPFSVHGLEAGSDVNRVPDSCSFDLLTGFASLPSLPPDVQLAPLPEDAKVTPAVTASLRAWRALWERIRERLRGQPRPATGEFEPAGVLASVGTVRATSGGLVVGFDYRPLPGEDSYALFQAVAALAEEATAAAGGALVFEVRVTINRPAMDLPADGPLVEAASAALAARGLPVVCSTLPQYTDGAMYASCNLDVVVFGPGWWGDGAAFGPESVPLQHLELAVEVYRDIIRRLCT